MKKESEDLATIMMSGIFLVGFTMMLSSLAKDEESKAKSFTAQMIEKFGESSPIWFYGILGVLAVILIIAVCKSLKNEDVLYAKQMSRYNELRYCENCNTIYDNNGRAEDANFIGMKK